MPGLGKVHLPMWEDVREQETSLTLVWVLLGTRLLGGSCPTQCFSMQLFTRCRESRRHPAVQPAAAAARGNSPVSFIASTRWE